MRYVPKKRKEKKKVGRTREGVVNSRCDHFFFFFNGVHTISVICVRCIFKSAVISEKDVLRFRREKKNGTPGKNRLCRACTCAGIELYLRDVIFYSNSMDQSEK